MRIRTQLILASFVLAVLPLTAIVIWSYHSSREALEAAQSRETRKLARQMDRRLASIRQELEQRLAVVSALPLQSTAENAKGGDRTAVGNIVTAMGEVAGLVDSLEFQPVAMPAPPAEPAVVAEPRRPAGVRRGPAPMVAVGMPEAPPPPDPARVADATPAMPPHPAPGLHPNPNPNPHPKVVVVHDVDLEPIVIELPAPVEFPKFVLPAQHRDLIRVITRVAPKLRDVNLPADERARLQKELEDARTELGRVTEESRLKFEAQLREAQQMSDARRDILLEQARAQRERARIQRENERQRRAAGSTTIAPLPAPVKTLTQVAEEAPKPKPATANAKKTQPKKSTTTAAEKAKVKAQVKAQEKSVSLLLGRDFNAPVKEQGEVVGQISARVRPEEVVQRVLGTRTEDSDEIPFAIDRENNVYTRTTEEKGRLETLGVPRRVRENRPLNDIEGWIVTVNVDRESGLRIGVARPVGENLTELKKIAARNFGIGLGLIAFALIGIVPLANHLTRDVQLVTEGAQRIAHGDLMTRLPVESKNEFGQLAMAFNRMAEDLSLQQQRLLEQERTSKEQELQQRLMAVEYDRKTADLEDARRFQLSMLPKEVPRHETYDVAVYTRTATEVGGDYYDFHTGDGTFAVAIGDATGHGAKAGTMVTVVKTLFAGYGGEEPTDFLRGAAEKIKRMELGRMSMALALGRFTGSTLTLGSAGMPPVLIHRAATKTIDEIALEATPLGTLGKEYAQTRVEVSAGDTVLFMTDGFPELLNDAGQQFGYTGAADAFMAAAGGATADAVIASLTDIVRRWHGDHPPNDDVTFVAVRVRAV
jgi:serine phosphatase RsbU (regulator of sigma subunit)